MGIVNFKMGIVQNGKIITSINIKKLQRDNMGVQLWKLLTMPHITQTLKKFLVKKNFYDVKYLGWGPYSPMFNPIEQV